MSGTAELSVKWNSPVSARVRERRGQTSVRSLAPAPEDGSCE